MMLFAVYQTLAQTLQFTNLVNEFVDVVLIKLVGHPINNDSLHFWH